MAYSKAQLIAIEQQLSGAYHEAEKRLIAILGQVELSDWQRARAADQLAQVQAVLDALGEHTEAWADTHVPTLYAEGLSGADELLDAAGAGLPVPQGFARLHTESIQILGENIVMRYDEVLQTVGRRADDFFRQAGLLSLQEATALGTDRRSASRLMVQQLKEKGITGFVDARGTEWSLGTYAEMHARTVSRECTNLGTQNRLRERGHDLVQVSDHGGACEKCAPWEGEILSISGESSEYPSVAEAEADGLFHPNCVHVLVPWIPGYSSRAA